MGGTHVRLNVRFGHERKNVEDFRTDMLKKFWSDRKTADDDADRTLGPTPESQEFHIVALVGRFGKLIAVVSAHYGRHASLKASVCQQGS